MKKPKSKRAKKPGKVKPDKVVAVAAPRHLTRDLVGAPAKPEIDLSDARLRRAIELIGDCLSDLGKALIQGARAENAMLRGNAAIGLERAAAYVRGEEFKAVPAPEHTNAEAEAEAIRKAKPA